MEGIDHTVIAGRRIALIRIPKCASRSMARSLGLSGGVHKPRKMIEQELPEGPVEFITCFRNPLERLVSWHAYHAEDDPLNYFGAGVRGFREWVRNGCPNVFPSRSPEMHLFEQVRWMKGSIGSLTILRFERLEEDWNAFWQGSGPPLVHINKSEHGEWESYFDLPTRLRAECLVSTDLSFEKP